MNDIIISSPARLGADRLHHAAARLQTIAWINVNMPAPQTVRAMIGKAIAFDRLPAMAAFEIFYAPGKSHCALARNRTSITSLEGWCSIH